MSVDANAETLKGSSGKTSGGEKMHEGAIGQAPGHDVLGWLRNTKTKIGRRQVLAGGAAAAGLGLTALYAPGVLRGGEESAKSVVSPDSPILETKLTTGQLLEQIKTKIDDSVLDLETKRIADGVIKDLSTANTYLEKCMAAYEPLKGDMRSFLRARLGRMDLSPVWKGIFASEEEFLDNQLSFVSDKRSLDVMVQIYADDKGFSVQDFAKRIVALRESDGHIGPTAIDRNLPTLDNPGFFIDVSNSSGRVAQRLQEVSARLPALVHSDVKLTSGVLKESVGATLNIANSNSTSLQIELNSSQVGQDPDMAEYALLHEDGHQKRLQQSEGANVLPRYLSPEALIKLYYEDLKVFNETSTLGAHPQIDRIFRPGRRRVERMGVRGMLTKEQFSDIISTFSDQAWIGQTTNSKGSLRKPIFDNRFLPLDAVSEVVDAYKSRALEGGKASRISDLPKGEQDWLNTYDYDTVEDFLKGEQVTLEGKLSQSSKYWEVGLSLLKENVHRFRNFRLWSPIYDSSVPLPMDQAPSTWYSKGLPTFVNLLFCEAFFNNDRKVVDLFTEAERKEIIGSMILLENFCQDEEFADGWALTAYSGTDSFNGVKNPYQSVHEVAASIVHKT